MTVTQLTVGTTTPVAITIQQGSPTQNVIIIEDGTVSGWPTTRWQYSGPVWSPSNATVKQAGQSQEFASPPIPWKYGQTIGYILALDGASTFDQIEMP